jgi:predicted nucleotidyltransferase
MATETLFSSTAFERVVLFYLVHPDSAPHVRMLQRLLGIGMRSLQAELARLAGRGLLQAEREAKRSIYRANPDHPGWTALRAMVRAFGDPAEVLRVALAPVPGIEAAFVFGSIARGDAVPESDVDVLIVGDDISRPVLGRVILESSAVIGRDVNVARYTPDELAEAVARGDSFVRNVLGGGKRWIVGEPRSLDELAA